MSAETCPPLFRSGRIRTIAKGREPRRPWVLDIYLREVPEVWSLPTFQGGTLGSTRTFALTCGGHTLTVPVIALADRFSPEIHTAPTLGTSPMA